MDRPCFSRHNHPIGKTPGVSDTTIGMREKLADIRKYRATSGKLFKMALGRKGQDHEAARFLRRPTGVRE